MSLKNNCLRTYLDGNCTGTYARHVHRLNTDPKAGSVEPVAPSKPVPAPTPVDSMPDFIDMSHGPGITTNEVTSYVDTDGDGISDQKHIETIKVNYIDIDGDGKIDGISVQSSTLIKTL